MLYEVITCPPSTFPPAPCCAGTGAARRWAPAPTCGSSGPSAAGKRAQTLGGAKNFLIVLPDADMDATLDACVITSYSIHYTKLYETDRAAKLGNSSIFAAKY